VNHRSPLMLIRRTIDFGAGLALAAGMLLVSLAATAEIPQNTRAAEDAAYPCDNSGGPADQLARAKQLAAHTFDRNQLACATDLYTGLVAAGTPDKELLTTAMATGNSYLKQVNIERDLDFVGAQTGEWLARTAKVSQQLETLRSLATKLYPDDVALQVLGAQADMLTHRYSDPTEFIVAFKRSVATFTKATEVSPSPLDGAEFVYLGKAYLDAPPIFGGSPKRAVEALEQARRIDPNDAERLGFLAQAYDQTSATERLEQVLKELLALNPRQAVLQDLADAWMTGIGLADRLNNRSLLAQFKRSRHALLAAHPELLTRARTGIAGHGGEDPLTGEKQY
jgi:tetratricopeptide (TPR) repeat protein